MGVGPIPMYSKCDLHSHILIYKKTRIYACLMASTLQRDLRDAFLRKFPFDHLYLSSIFSHLGSVYIFDTFLGSESMKYNQYAHYSFSNTHLKIGIDFLEILSNVFTKS